ncbi:unnamed protein product [Clonostachys rosea]|uniref:F-box domain-containing protein n=1 Tax=Bionectria ochroleuca TaxID=29856 RepID=A0ABY6U3N2_BIOOC|nr:unnamed protein product [Clonostachys rosea]
MAARAASQPTSTPSSIDGIDKVARLEQRVNLLENQLRAEIQELRLSLMESTNGSGSNTSDGPVTVLGQDNSPHSQQEIARPVIQSSQCETPIYSRDIVSIGIVTEEEWNGLYDFFRLSCTSVIAVMDDQIFAAPGLVRSHLLMSVVICVIAARAVKPDKYQTYLAQADEMIKDTFQGPTVNIMVVKAIMLLAAWTGRTRLWGYVTSLATELGLNLAAIELGNEKAQASADLVDRARTWFSLCCFDLVMNVNRPFVINRMRDYLQLATKLLASPFCLPVDYRICAYVKGFTIAADVKGAFHLADSKSVLLTPDREAFMETSNEQVEKWFYHINNNLNPLYQTFSDKQDRNRFLIPYCFILMYINGFVLHGLEATGDFSNGKYLAFVQKAFDSALLLIRTQWESDQFREGLRYTMDYNGYTTYYAINFILNAMTIAHMHLKHGNVFEMLQRAAQMYEQAGAVEAANEVRRERERIADLTQTAITPQAVASVGAIEAENPVLYDISSFLDEATWDEEFPTLNPGLWKPAEACGEEHPLPSVLQLLPVELQHKIIQQLDPVGLVSLSQSCRYFRRLINPGKKELVERLLQLECSERYGGMIPLCYIPKEGSFKPIWDLSVWEAHRWACTSCLRLLPHTDFDNHSILGRAYRKPPFRSAAANLTTSWLPSLRGKVWGRSAGSPNQVEEREDEAQVSNQGNKSSESRVCGYRRWRRKCNECRFRAGELGPKRSVDRSEILIYRGGTQNVPIQKSRWLYFESCLDRWFPEILNVLSPFLDQLPSPPVQQGPIKLDVTASRWTTYMIRCPCCTTWQEMRNFRFGSGKKKWFPYHHGDGVVASLAHNGDNTLRNPDHGWTVPVRTQLDDLLCNRCFMNEHGAEALAEALLEWLRIPLLKHRYQLEQRLRTPISELKRHTRHNSNLDTMVTRQESELLLPSFNIELAQRHHDQFREFCDTKIIRRGNAFAGRRLARIRVMAEDRIYHSRFWADLERNRRIRTWNELFDFFRSNWNFALGCEEELKKRPHLLVQWALSRDDV